MWLLIPYFASETEFVDEEIVTMSLAQDDGADLTVLKFSHCLLQEQDKETWGEKGNKTDRTWYTLR